jgi:hypothetical protein
MLLLFLAAAAAAPAPTRAPQAHVDNMPVQDLGSGNPKCPPMSRYEAARRGGKLNPQFLDELPAADVYKAVYRRIGGCIAPVIVRYGVGRP